MRKAWSLLGTSVMFWAQAALAVQPSECSRVVVSADPEFPPYAWYDGQALRGASVDVVLAVLRTIKLPYELQYAGPFLRLLRSAAEGRVDIITELKRTPDREVYLEYSQTPIFSNPTAVFVRVGEAIPNFNGRHSLRGFRGGITRGNRFGDGLDEYLDRHLNVEEGPGIRENFSKLEARRFDYFLSPYYPAATFLVSHGLGGKFEALKPFVAEANVYVGWSRKSACIGRLREFDAALKQYLTTSNGRELLDASFDTWKRMPVMVR